MQKIWKPGRALVGKAVKAAFFAAGRGPGLLKDKLTVSIVLVDNAGIINVNKKFLGRDTVTDVIAFNLQDGFTPESGGVWGEVVVSTEKARLESKKRKLDFNQEVMLYVIHGILHLLGYDDHSAKDIKKMRAKEQEAMRKMKNEK
ncbi:MAG: rRNA maturation RNase YbeY [Planctomycetes bacterium]|nr:rRNA maturation RNase YbeY [Planctomycetota bacterium]